MQRASAGTTRWNQRFPNLSLYIGNIRALPPEFALTLIEASLIERSYLKVLYTGHTRIDAIDRGAGCPSVRLLYGRDARSRYSSSSLEYFYTRHNAEENHFARSSSETAR